MHDFFSGIPTEMEKPVKNLAAAGTLTLEADQCKNTEEFNKLLQALPKLVDGNEKAGAWNDSYVKINANHAQGPFTLTADLGGIGQVERVALGSVSNPGWGSGAPDSVSYSVSQDGQTWKELGTVTYAQAEISPGAANLASRRSSMCSSWMPPKRPVISARSSATAWTSPKTRLRPIHGWAWTNSR